MSKVISKVKSIWSDLADKEARDEYVSARIETDVAYQIYALRKQRNLTQAGLAERCGNPNGQGAICRLEGSAEGISVSTLKELASAFDVALSIKFVPFSQLVDDAITERLDRAIPEFADDKIPMKFAPLPFTFGVGRPSHKFSLAPAKPWVDTTLSAQSKRLVEENIGAS